MTIIRFYIGSNFNNIQDLKLGSYMKKLITFISFPSRKITQINYFVDACTRKKIRYDILTFNKVTLNGIRDIIVYVKINFKT